MIIGHLKYMINYHIKMKSLEEAEFITKKKIQPIKKSKYDILFKTGFRNMHFTC